MGNCPSFFAESVAALKQVPTKTLRPTYERHASGKTGYKFVLEGSGPGFSAKGNQKLVMESNRVGYGNLFAYGLQICSIYMSLHSTDGDRCRGSFRVLGLSPTPAGFSKAHFRPYLSYL